MQDMPSSSPDTSGNVMESAGGEELKSSSSPSEPDTTHHSMEVAEAVVAMLKVSIQSSLRQENAALIKKIRQVFQEELRGRPAPSSIKHGNNAPGNATKQEGIASDLSLAKSADSIPFPTSARRVSFSPSEASVGSAGSRSIESVPSSVNNMPDVKTMQMRVADMILGAKSLVGAPSAHSHTRVSPQDETGGHHDSIFPGGHPSKKSLVVKGVNFQPLDQVATAATVAPSSPPRSLWSPTSSKSAVQEKKDANQGDEHKFQEVNSGRSFANPELGGMSATSSFFNAQKSVGSEVGSPASSTASLGFRVEDMQRLRSAELSERLRTNPDGSRRGSLGSITEAMRESGVSLNSLVANKVDSIEPDRFTAPFVLVVCGILPWIVEQSGTRMCTRFLCYRGIVVFLAIVSGASLVHQVVQQPDMCSKHPVLTDVPLAAGGVLSLISLTSVWHQSSAFHDSYLLLHIFAQREDVLRQLQMSVGWDSAMMVLLWMAVVLDKMRTGGLFCEASDGYVHWWEVLPFMAFAVCTGLIMGASFCMLHVSRGMSVLIDRFCLNVMNLEDQGHIIQCVSTWNVLQAVIRKLSGVLERCFFLVQVVAALIVSLGVIDVLRAGKDDRGARDLPDLIPGLLVMCYILRTFFAAVQVTDKSLRVAPLITSLHDGDSVDIQRQFVVQHIVSSVPGFYVFDVCLTTSMAFKFTYFCGVVFLGLVARVVSNMEY